jgi:hypothetical protein
MNSDCFFSIGTTHKICQDYVRSGNIGIDNKQYHYVFLADGCSSVIDADIGSRLLVLATEHNFIDYVLHNESIMDNDSIFERAILYTKELAINSVCLSSTLLKIIINGIKYRIESIGDGTIVVKRKNGIMSIISISFPSGYPYYLTYTGISLDNFLKRSPVFNKKITIIDTLNNIVNEEETLVKNVAPYSISFCENTNDIEFAAVFSDGIGSFYRVENDGTSIKNVPIDEIEVIRKCLDFKSFNGQFVQRRMQAFFKECKKLGWEHSDDFSVGVVYNGELQEKKLWK